VHALPNHSQSFLYGVFKRTPDSHYLTNALH
jgi:hypothetical protein